MPFRSFPTIASPLEWTMAASSFWSFWARRRVSWRRAISAPVMMKTTSESSSPGSRIVKLRTGPRYQYQATSPDSAVASIPGQKPPYQAANMTAG